MEKFSAAFRAGVTQVRLHTEEDFRLVLAIHESRRWIKVSELDRNVSRHDVVEFRDPTVEGAGTKVRLYGEIDAPTNMLTLQEIFAARAIATMSIRRCGGFNRAQNHTLISPYELAQGLFSEDPDAEALAKPVFDGLVRKGFLRCAITAGERARVGDYIADVDAYAAHPELCKLITGEDS